MHIEYAVRFKDGKDGKEGDRIAKMFGGAAGRWCEVHGLHFAGIHIDRDQEEAFDGYMEEDSNVITWDKITYYD